MRKLQLLDEENGDIYVLNVTEEDYVRADDLTYRTKLLENAKKNLRESDDTTEKEAVDDSETYNDGFRWVNQAVRLLLAAYKDREDLLIKGKVSVKKFWEIISQILKEKSYNITGPRCKSKFHSLKKTYKNIKDHNAKSGNNRRTWPFFEIMDEMFGHKPWMNPILTLDSANDIPSGSSICSNSDTTSPSSEMSLSPSLLTSTNERPKKRKKVEETALEDLVAIAKENKEERKNMYEETAARQERLLHILESIANKM